MADPFAGDSRSRIDPLRLHDAAMHSLATALDGCTVRSGSVVWTAWVCGVHADDHGWWIQVSAADDASASIVVRCSRFARLAHLRAALGRWRPRPSYSLQILDGMSRC